MRNSIGITLVLAAVASCSPFGGNTTLPSRFATPTPTPVPPTPTPEPSQPPITHSLRKPENWEQLAPGVFRLTNIEFEDGKRPAFKEKKLRISEHGMKDGEYHVFIISSIDAPGEWNDGRWGDGYLCKHVPETDVWRPVTGEIAQEYFVWKRATTPSRQLSEFLAENYGLAVKGDMGDTSKDEPMLLPNRTGVIKVETGDWDFNDSLPVKPKYMERATYVAIGSENFLFAKFWLEGEGGWLALYATPISKKGALRSWKKTNLKQIALTGRIGDWLNPILAEKEGSVFMVQYGDGMTYSFSQGAFPVNW